MAKQILMVPVLLLATMLAQELQAQNSSVKTDIEGGFIQSKSFKTNLIIYRSVGGKTTVKSNAKSRKWWCLWLCKKNKGKKAESIQITNTYYTLFNNVLIPSAPRSKTCTNTSSCTLKEWAFGFGLKFKFDPPGGAGGPSPVPVDGLLPINGVVTGHVINVDGHLYRVTTAAGQHP